MLASFRFLGSSRRWTRVLFVRSLGVVGARGVFLEVRRIYVHADFRFLAFKRLAKRHRDLGFLCFGFEKACFLKLNHEVSVCKLPSILA